MPFLLQYNNSKVDQTVIVHCCSQVRLLSHEALLTGATTAIFKSLNSSWKTSLKVSRVTNSRGVDGFMTQFFSHIFPIASWLDGPRLSVLPNWNHKLLRRQISFSHPEKWCYLGAELEYLSLFYSSSQRSASVTHWPCILIWGRRCFDESYQ